MTQAQESDAEPKQKLLAGRAIKTRIAVASGLLLAGGWLLTPRAAPTALSAPQERVAPLLEEQVQLREVVRPFRGVQDVALRVRGHGIAIPSFELRTVATRNDFSQSDVPSRSAAAGYGVFVAETYVLTHALALHGRSSILVSTADGRALEAHVAAYEPLSGLVLLRTEPSESRTVALAREPPDAGTLAVAVGTWEGRDIAVPVFVTRVESGRYTIGPIDGSVSPGMPVYTLDGELLALAAGDGGEGHAFPAREASEGLIARASRGERPASIGIAFQELTGPLARAFGEKGVLINDVIAGGPADVAGLQAGDVLLAVGDVEVDSADTAARALSATAVGAATTIRVHRNRRVRTAEVTPALTYEVAALARTRAEDGLPGPHARALFPAALLDRAGIPAAARVLSVNGRAVSSRAQAGRELRRGRGPVPLLLEHRDSRFFAAIEPAQ